jgi:hypothetical protein
MSTAFAMWWAGLVLMVLTCLSKTDSHSNHRTRN